MILSPEAFQALKSQKRRLLGLDVGTKTIGLALSDILWSIASPYEVILRRKFTLDAKELIKIIDEFKVGGLVVGLPVNMDGTEGPRAQSTRSFIDNFLALHDMPVLLWDERFSTNAVTRMMLEADLSRKRRDELVDKLAASYILQGALDRLQKAE
ncbi:MAG: Holliday junction resolvase RuvX [Candidatus Nucleicultricaceae bacterium]